MVNLVHGVRREVMQRKRVPQTFTQDIYEMNTIYRVADAYDYLLHEGHFGHLVT